MSEMAATTTVPADAPEIDWPAFDRQARRVAVAKVPLVPVRVAFHPNGLGHPALTATWFGQVYGALAVCQVGEAPPRCDVAADAGWYQLIHVPTGLWLRAHKKAHPLRVLALALGDTGIDWAGMDHRGLAGLPEGERIRAQGIVRSWGDSYAR